MSNPNTLCRRYTFKNLKWRCSINDTLDKELTQKVNELYPTQDVQVDVFENDTDETLELAAFYLLKKKVTEQVKEMVGGKSMFLSILEYDVDKSEPYTLDSPEVVKLCDKKKTNNIVFSTATKTPKYDDNY